MNSILQAFLLFVFLFSPLRLYAMDSHEILEELERDDWQTQLLNDRAVSIFRDKSNFDNLIAVVNDREIDWRIRIRGIKIVGETRIPAAAAELAAMFTEKSFHFGCPSIKLYIASGLGNYPNNAAVTLALIEGLGDVETLVREESAKSLGKIGDPSAVPYLGMALKDRSFAVKIRAINALVKISDPAAYRYLKHVIDNMGEDPLIRRAALSGVEMLPAKEN